MSSQNNTQFQNMTSEATPNLESEVSPLNTIQTSHESSAQSNSHLIQQNASSFRSKILGSEFFNSLLEATTENNVEEIKMILGENKDVDLKRCSDSKGYSLIHKAILNNQVELVRYFIKYAYSFEIKYCNSEQDIKKNLRLWINQQTVEDQFTAIHLASFRGLIEIMQILDQYEADYSKTNVKGTNVIHFAAQGDQPKALVYLKNKGLDLNVLDDKKGTPLHWASFLGHENSVNYLVSWDVDLNRQDNDGLSPLHLATLMGFSRIVKKLLIRGSKRDLKDEHGKTPYDIAKEKKFTNIMSMIKMNPYSFQEYCNIKPAFKPVKNPLRQVFLFMLMYWVGLIVYVFFDFPFFYGDFYWAAYASVGSIFVTMIFFIISWQKDPGFIKVPKRQRNSEQLLQLLKQVNDPNKICPDCVVFKSDRSRHCEICKSCVSVYDHHCPWINNCVGSGNHFYFYIFIICIWINLAMLITFIAINLCENFQHIDNPHFTWFNSKIGDGEGHIRPPSSVQYVFMIGNITLAALFEFPLTFLIIVQTNNLLMNKTTFERFNQHALQQQSVSMDPENQNSNLSQSQLTGQESQFQSTFNQPQQAADKPAKFSKNCGNCFQMCCRNQEIDNYNLIDIKQQLLQSPDYDDISQDMTESQQIN